jgi:hypothetical protein
LARFRLNVLYFLINSDNNIIPRSDIELEIISRFTFNEHLIEQIDSMYQDSISSLHQNSSYAFASYATFTFCIKGNIERAKSLFERAESESAFKFQPDIRFLVFLRKKCLEELIL